MSACRLRLLSNESRELSEKESYEVSSEEGVKGEGHEGRMVVVFFKGMLGGSFHDLDISG